MDNGTLKKNGWGVDEGRQKWDYKTKTQIDFEENHVKQIYMNVDVDYKNDGIVDITLRVAYIPFEAMNEFYTLFGKTPSDPKRRTTTEIIDNFVKKYTDK
jgi:hypothetical protein